MTEQSEQREGAEKARPYPDLLSETERKSLLYHAEQLWANLQANDLGGFSGINRPFYILSSFKEVIEGFGHRDVGYHWSKADLEAAQANRAAEPLLIWWTNQQDCTMIKALFFRLSAGWSEDDGSPSWPSYLADEYSGRYGRSGRGRLWVAAQLPAVEISPWPDTPFARLIAENYAGIAIRRGDVEHVAGLPGIITDTKLELIDRN